MVDPLARTIMNNEAKKSGKVNSRSKSHNDSSTSKIHITSSEEKQLLNIINKTNYKKKDYKSTNYNKENHSNYKRNATQQKIKLEDLAGNKNKSRNEEKIDKKSNTMMTLNDLASKVTGKVSNKKEC